LDQFLRDGDPSAALYRPPTVNGSGNPVVGGVVEEPSRYYAYTLDNAADVRSIVMAGAGVGRI
jgi:pectate lyase